MKSFAKYEILETITKSGASAVYLARHVKLNRRTLLKVYSGSDKSIINRFEREARVVADLNSSSVVSIYDFGEENGQYYISMEFIDGSNLGDFLQNHELSVDQMLEFVYQISLALSVLHGKGYIHRDLKPENILVDKNGLIKLTDFGISIQESLKRITSEASILGTPLYMSPEQINNLPLVFSSDIFALGIIFYQMTTGVHPFEAPQVGEILSKILSVSPRPVREINPHIPEWFSDLIDRMLMKDTNKRIADAFEVLKILHTNLPHLIVPEPASGKESQSIRSSIRRSLTVFILVAIVFSVYFFLWKDADSSKEKITSPADTIKITMTDTFAFNNDIPEKQVTPIDEKPLRLPVTDQEKLKKTDIDYFGYAPEYVALDTNETILFIQTYPWCNVFIDYQQVDKTPMTEGIKLRPGRYMLGLQNPLYPSLSDSIWVAEKKKNIYTYNLDSCFVRINLDVQPWGRVFINGKYFGTTPLREPIYLTREDHILEIQNDYYEVWQDTLKWNGNAVLNRSVVLKDKRQ